MISRLIAAFAALALTTASVEARAPRARDVANDLAVGAVVSIGVATVIAGGAMLGGADARTGLTVFAAVAAGLAGLQAIIAGITDARERSEATGSNVARNASTRVTTASSSDALGTAAGAAR